MGMRTDRSPLQDWLACWLALVGREADNYRTPRAIHSIGPALAAVSARAPVGTGLGCCGQVADGLDWGAFYIRGR